MKNSQYDANIPKSDTLYMDGGSRTTPGRAATPASKGIGDIYDNHGNWVSGHEFYAVVDGLVRHYHLDDAQYNYLWYKLIAPHAAAAGPELGLRNTDEIPLVNGVTESPLVTEQHMLDEVHAPWTPAPRNAYPAMAGEQYSRHTGRNVGLK